MVRIYLLGAPTIIIAQIAVYTFPALWLVLLIVSILKLNLSYVRAHAFARPSPPLS